MSEEVMVVPTSDLAPLFGGRTFDLIRDDSERILDVIQSCYLFLPRPQAESAPQYRQIIPYVVIRHGDDFFLLRRTPKQTEARLHDRLSLGIGGHINPDSDESDDGILVAGLRKELDEEVEIEAEYEARFVAILNDETTEVSRVHLGLVYELVASSPQVAVRETEKMSGSWVARSDLGALRESMETWSQVVYDQFIAKG
jgi:predicted NUDIX family phosphoesterase